MHNSNKNRVTVVDGLGQMQISAQLADLLSADPFVKIELEGYEHGEERWRAVGQVGRTLLIVSYTLREKEGEEAVRIISARKAQPLEHRRYEGNS